jgi:hypothetical protein
LPVAAAVAGDTSTLLQGMGSSACKSIHTAIRKILDPYACSSTPQTASNGSLQGDTQQQTKANNTYGYVTKADYEI